MLLTSVTSEVLKSALVDKRGRKAGEEQKNKKLMGDLLGFERWLPRSSLVGRAVRGGEVRLKPLPQ